MAEQEQTCALCGGELDEHELTDEREEELRHNIPSLDEEGKDIHAHVCQDCGHISYYTD